MEYFQTIADRGELTQRLKFTLPKKVLAFYRARAKAAGRSLEMQFGYELLCMHNGCLPDPGDTFGAFCRYVVKGIR